MHRQSKVATGGKEVHLGLKLQDSSCPWQLKSGRSSRPRVDEEDTALFLDAIFVSVTMDDDVRHAIYSLPCLLRSTASVSSVAWQVPFAGLSMHRIADFLCSEWLPGAL